MRIIKAASAGTFSPLQGIAPAVALTHDLLNMKTLSAINAVLAVLGITMSDASLKAVGLDPPSLRAAGFDTAAFRAAGCSWADIFTAGFTSVEAKAAGCDLAAAKSAGYDEDALVTAFGLNAVAAFGCDVSFILVSRVPALLLALTRVLELTANPSPLAPPHSPPAPPPPTT